MTESIYKCENHNLDFICRRIERDRRSMNKKLLRKIFFFILGFLIIPLITLLAIFLNIHPLIFTKIVVFLVCCGMGILTAKVWS